MNSEDLECQTLPLLSKAAKIANFSYMPALATLPEAQRTLRRTHPDQGISQRALPNHRPVPNIVMSF